jgi:hypothetical protein
MGGKGVLSLSLSPSLHLSISPSLHLSISPSLHLSISPSSLSLSHSLALSHSLPCWAELGKKNVDIVNKKVISILSLNLWQSMMNKMLATLPYYVIDNNFISFYESCI